MLKKLIWLACCLACCSFPAFAGKHNPQPANPVDSRTAQAVLDRLYATNGNFRYKKPRLVISPENKKVAAFSPWKNTITLDEKAYRICRGFGNDSLAALAYILGHELVHACQSQIRGQRQQTNFLAYDQGYNADIRTEKVADLQGVFNAYLAGYGVLKSMPEVIGQVYRDYGLEGRTLPGYPPLEERKASSREVVAIATELCAVFEACNYLMAIDETALACTGYEYILRYYQGLEIYNNLGVAYTLSARQYWNPDTDNFIYPIEADWNTKLERISAARGQEQSDPSLEPLRQVFIDKALACFGEAASLAPAYLPARINKVCALNMAGRPVEALRYAELNLRKPGGAKTKNPDQESEMADIALGITYALQPGGARRAEAEALLMRLAGSRYPLNALYGQQNLQALRKTPELAKLVELPLPEALHGVLDQLQPGRTAGFKRITLDEKSGIQFAWNPEDPYGPLVFSNARGNIISLLRASKRQAEGLKMPSNREDLTAAAYRNMVAAKAGYYLRAAREKAVLKIDARGQVLEVLKYVLHGQ